MRILKILAATVAAVFALLVVAGILLAYWFDPNDYKDYVTAYVEERTGRTLSIDEDLELSLFPWLAVETGGITLGNSPDFGAEPFATIESVSARVRVWPLLKRRIEIGTVVVDGIVLNLGVDDQGRTNWSDLLERRGSGEEAAEAPAAADGAEGFENYAVEGVRIRNGRLLWREGADIRYIVSDLSLTTDTIADDEPIDLELGFALLDVASQLTLELRASAVAEVETMRVADVAADARLLDARQQERASGRMQLESLSLAGERIELGQLSANGRVRDAPVGPEQVDARLSLAGASFDRATGEATVAELVTAVNDVETRWQIAATGLPETPSVTGRMTLDPAAAASLFALGSIEPPAGLAPATLGQVSASADFSANRSAGGPVSVTVENARLQMLGLELRGSATRSADGGLRADLNVPRASASAALKSLAASYAPESVDVGVIDSVGLKGRLTRSADGGTTTLDDVELELASATLKGRVAIETAGDSARYRGRLQTPRIDPALITGLVGEFLAESLGAREIGAVAIDTAFDYDAASDRLNLSTLALEAFGLEATGNVAVAGLSRQPVFSGRAALASFAPREVLRRFGQPVPETSDAAALGKAEVAGAFTVDSSHGEFRDLVVALDDSRITGSFRVDDFANPGYRFDLAADRIDVDRYLPPPADEVDEGERAAGAIAIKAEPLAAIKLAGMARVGDLKLANLRFQQVETALDVGAGQLKLEPARANLYGGQFAGGFDVDARPERPTMHLHGQAADLALAPLIAALAGESSVSGTASFDLDLTGTGETVTESMSTAAGMLGFAIRNGSIDGFNLEKTLCRVFNRADGLPAPTDAPDRTNFSVIRAAGTVSDGIVSSRELVMTTQALEISGSGRLTLVDQQLDYDMEAKQTRSIAIARCETMDRHIGRNVPFTIKGPLTEPEILPDFSEYLRDRVRDEVQDRVRESIQDRLLRRLQ